MNNTFNQFLIFFAGSFVCLYLAFSPTVNIPYTNHDSIRYFHKFYEHNSTSRSNPLYGYLKADGRFVEAELEELLYKNINHLSDMSRLRLITVAIVALCASLLIMSAQSSGMETIPAFCLGVTVFTLPGVQDIIFVPYPWVALAVFLSLLAYFILTKKLICGMHFMLTLVLLEIVFFMYPPAAFFFLVPTMFMAIFHNNWQVFKKIGARAVLLWVLSAVVYYFMMKVFFYAQIKATGHEIAFSVRQIMSNIITFVPQALPQIFNLWDVYYSKALGVSMIIFVAACLVIDSFVTKKIGWRRIAALAVLFVVFNLVWFLFDGYLPRQFMAAQGLALALVYWCGEWLGGKNKIFVRIWPVLFVSVGLIIANRMVSSNVLNNYSELMFIRSRLAQFVSSSTKEIHVIRVKDATRGYNGLPTVYDNINSITHDYEIPDLVRVALKDLANPFELHCMVTYSNDGEPFRVSSNSVVIDMNDLVYISSPQQK